MTACTDGESNPARTCGCQPSVSTEPQAFVSIRSALIFVIAFLCAAVVGVLTFLANGNVPGAVLAGLCAMGGAFLGLHLLIR
ncbi:glycerol uptake facilitator-like aquaporin [Saccharothrix longispora]|uniref:Glycerol uptake facilitator-like aquaporin n=1 Tax=Saccharothrix longispora TaxID=33920 RepID=A0ABU1PPF7_9PSEU|nr:glycerol uptake facilitator-like aquaporin [Saccharothrix longispora]